MFTFLDFFSGIGGFRTGLERVGGECKGFAEIDKYARQSYKAMHNTEGELEWHDITAVTDEHFRNLRGQVDLIAGGFPCQAFSVAGKRMGFDESRGTLFFHIARAAKEIQPRYLLLENVKGLVSHDQGRTLTVILNTLQELGYGHIEWGIFNSKFWGVPQNRERIFIVAELTEEPQRPYLLDLLKDQEENGVQTRLRDILETNVDEKYYLSDDKTKALIEKLDDRVLVKEATTKGYAEAYPGDAVNMAQPNSKTRRGRVGREIANTLLTGLEQAVIEPQVLTPKRTKIGGGREPKMVEPAEVRAVLTPDRTKKRQNGRRFKENDEPMFTLTAQDRHGVMTNEPQVKSIGNTNPSGNGMNGHVFSVEAGLSPTLTTNKGEGVKIALDDKKMVTAQYDRKNGIGKELEVALCLSASDWRGMNRNQAQNAVIETKPYYRIRKLTPLECWRLQGFSDEQHQAAVDEGLSDSQRYKQAGNSVTVNVIEAIGNQLAERMTWNN